MLRQFRSGNQKSGPLPTFFDFLRTILRIPDIMVTDNPIITALQVIQCRKNIQQIVFQVLPGNHPNVHRKTFPEVTSPKSNESTNSTTSAYSFVPLIFTRGGTRGGAFRLIHGCTQENLLCAAVRPQDIRTGYFITAGKGCQSFGFSEKSFPPVRVEIIILYKLFPFSPLTFREVACKIDSVWCTLPQYFWEPAFHDNRRISAGVCVFTSYADVLLMNCAGYCPVYRHA